MRFANVEDWSSDRTLELEGVACPIGYARELIVRRAGTRNREYVAGLIAVDPTDVPALERLFAETVVIGWRGLVDEHGAEIPYSVDACRELFRIAPDLLDHVARFAADRANFHARELEAEGDSLKVFPVGKRRSDRLANG